MFRGRVTAVVAAVTGSLALATAAAFATPASAVPQAASDQTWTDPVGDAQGGAPDLTAVAVSNDAAAGTIAITVTAPTALAGSLVVVFMDTNLNGKLDDPTDAYAAAAVLEDTAVWVDFRGMPQVDVFVTPSPTLEATSTTVTFGFAKAAVNIDEAFAFWVASETPDQLGAGQPGDEMPDGTGVFTYVLGAAPAPAPTPPPATAPAPAVVKPVIGSPVTSGRAVAGKRLTVTFPVTRSDNGKPLTSGRLICDPSVTGKVIKHAESFRAGKARLSFLVPKTAKGKLLKVKVTIKAGSYSATRIATFRVR